MNNLKPFQKYVCIIADEMKIKGVIYNKNEEGYTTLGEVNDRLLPNVSTPSIATYMLTVMVTGWFIKLCYPFASFPAKELCGSF